VHLDWFVFTKTSKDSRKEQLNRLVISLRRACRIFLTTSAEFLKECCGGVDENPNGRKTCNENKGAQALQADLTCSEIEAWGFHDACLCDDVLDLWKICTFSSLGRNDESRKGIKMKAAFLAVGKKSNCFTALQMAKNLHSDFQRFRF